MRCQHVDGGLRAISLPSLHKWRPRPPSSPSLELRTWFRSRSSILSFHLFDRRMSCCGGNCGCGAGCQCGSGCKGCKMYPDLTEEKSITSTTMVLGVAPQKGHFEGFEMAAGSENGGCKCNPCTCNPCTCK